MWQTLSKFSKKSLQSHYFDNKFEPLQKLIKILKNKDYADEVFAFTSLYTFIITFQPEYHANPTDSITISFDRRTGFFTTGYYDVKSKLGVNYRCIEKQTESLVDAFVLRMFFTDNN